jgi:hypothetical protein
MTSDASPVSEMVIQTLVMSSFLFIRVSYTFFIFVLLTSQHVDFCLHLFLYYTFSWIPFRGFLHVFCVLHYHFMSLMIRNLTFLHTQHLQLTLYQSMLSQS